MTSKYKIGINECLSKRYTVHIIEDTNIHGNQNSINISKEKKEEVVEIALRVASHITAPLVHVVEDVWIKPSIIKTIMIREYIWLPEQNSSYWDFERASWQDSENFPGINEDFLDIEYTKYQVLQLKNEKDQGDVKPVYVTKMPLMVATSTPYPLNKNFSTP